MKKIGDSTSTANASGEWTEGNPGAGLPATLLKADWLTTIQRELINVVLGGGLTLNPNDDSQLFKAIQALQAAASTWANLAGKPTTVAGFGISDAFTKTETGAAIQAAIAALVASSPAALDTLKELATALGNDPNFATTMTNALAGKAAKATTLAGYAIADAFTKTETNSAIQQAIAALVASSPAALDTLNELATALGNDPNFATTMASALADKVAKTDLKSASETVAGLISVASQPIVDAGNDDSRAVTPKKLSAYVANASNLVGVQGAFKGLILSASGIDYFASVSVEELILEDLNAMYRVLRRVSVSPSMVVSGPNGLDTGASVAATWYSVWVICTPSGVTAGLFSLSESAPVMPEGYTFKARVGWVRTDASRYPLRFSQYGRSVRYDVGNNVPAYPTVASGVASAAITVALTAVVPPTARRASLVAGTANGGYVGFAPAGAFTSTPGIGYLSPGQPNGFPFAGGYNASSPVPTTSGDIHLRSISVMYCATGASSILQCMGWEDNL